jgi:hypothetical protein
MGTLGYLERMLILLIGGHRDRQQVSQICERDLYQGEWLSRASKASNREQQAGHLYLLPNLFQSSNIPEP